MADTVLRREEGLLRRIERRPTAAEFSTEVNSTIQARTNNTPAPTRLPPNASIQSIYGRLTELEQQILMNYVDARAAELALQRGHSYPDVRALLQPKTMRMPAFRDPATQELDAGNAAGYPSATYRLKIRTIDDLNTYRQVLERSSRESGLAEARLMVLLGQAGPRQARAQATARATSPWVWAVAQAMATASPSVAASAARPARTPTGQLDPDQVGPRAEQLSELDEGRPQLGHGQTDPGFPGVPGDGRSARGL